MFCKKKTITVNFLLIFSFLCFLNIKALALSNKDSSSDLTFSGEPELLKQISGLHTKSIYFPYSYYFDISAYMGKYFVPTAQLYAPFTGNEQYLFYGAIDGKEAGPGNAWAVGGGLGLRSIFGERIYGLYLFGDFNSFDVYKDVLLQESSTGLSSDRHRFMALNPGFETLGMFWDFRVNGYFPIKNHSWVYNEYETNLNKSYDKIGYDGGFDSEVGFGPAYMSYAYAQSIKLFLGIYKFHSSEFGNINGTSVRLFWRINNNSSLEIKNTYDNVNKNTLMAGVKIMFGGFTREEREIGKIFGRMMDPVSRNLATIENGNTVPLRAVHKFITK